MGEATQIAEGAAALYVSIKHSNASDAPATVSDLCGTLSLLNRLAQVVAASGTPADDGRPLGLLSSRIEATLTPTEPANGRRPGPMSTMTAGQLAAWFSAMPADRPVIAYGPSGKADWYANIESLDLVDPQDGTALVISLADDFDTRQW